MMELSKQISAAWFHANFNRTGKSERRFSGDNSKTFLDDLFDANIPVYVDESYYVQCQSFHRAEKDGEGYKTAVRPGLERWRDCHYYTQYANRNGDVVWVLTGGRYD